MTDSAPQKKRPRREWGRIYKLSSGRIRASYSHNGKLYHPPKGTPGTGTSRTATFERKGPAEAWLERERKKIEAGTWTDPAEVAEVDAARTLTFAEHARERIEARELAPRTRKGYLETLENHLIGPFGARLLGDITANDVEKWYEKNLRDRPTARAHAYSLLHSVFREAVRKGIVDRNPCQLEKAMNARSNRDARASRRRVRVLTGAQLDAVIAATTEDLRAAVAIAGWCGLRVGELKGLHREDIAPDGSTVHVERAIAYRAGVYYEGPPKSEEGRRTVVTPNRIRAVLIEHLDRLESRSPHALAFPGNGGPEGYMTDWDLRRALGAAGKALDPSLFAEGLNPFAGDNPLRPHELRHTAATMAARVPGTRTKDIMARIGHGTTAAAMMYQNLVADQDAAIAAGLDAM